MKYTDVAIIGGGLAGSTTAAMLGRAGISAVLIDPYPQYPPDFRVEKLSGEVQVERFRKTGVAEATLRRATHDGENWIARFGYLLDKTPSQQYGIMYNALVNSIRAEIPASVDSIYAKAVSISTTTDRQKVVLSNGEEISARLVVLTVGLNVGLRRQLGIERRLISACHSISIGFYMAPVGRPTFDFPALTYFSERPSDRSGYLTLFPIGNAMRANLFVYRQIDDPWLRQMRDAPVETLNAMLPRLRKVIGDFEVTGDVKIRPVDLYVSSGYRQPGVILVGDAFETTCPVTGTGTDKVFTDVERLCNVHIPAWLAAEGMDESKIAAFYDDPVKTACDAWSAAKAFNFRSVSIETGIYWRALRWARFLARLGEGLWRRARERLHAEPKFRVQSSSSSSSLSSSA
ncbi:MAG: FAD-dependent monooxygenase [Bradyrhizobium sp.]|uniref:FAD-dependent oxidoreductase n=1 Tax=Bradyrhizobium sp. TaxID=376 RepID=UPI00120C2A6B|nr:NAD(P)/FAD-dependent oxidoreductase [Bradyrhizobium sp.]THD70686.1 MAG: FAD-dependent monooxygenase [Bradyrhizobium sp.]